VVARLPGAEPLKIPAAKASLLDPLSTALALRRLRSGVYFSPGFNGPIRCPIPFVFCIHDLIYLRFRQDSSLAHRAYFRLVVLPAAKRAFRLITGSEYARGTILEWTGLPAARVVAVGYGVSGDFTADGPRHEPGFPYFLYVGRRDAHKNLPRLVAAFARTRARAGIRLLFTGAADRRIEDLAARHGVRDAIGFTGILDDARLAACYRGAVALAFPSLYEGFGLPIVEAMACGIPALASRATAMPEVAGDAALLVDPTRTEDIALGLDRLAGDSALRSTLRVCGLARARQFSWEAVAGRIRRVLEEAPRGPG
jgi:glycosyltransferase involved in cell wall biosynthesis